MDFNELNLAELDSELTPEERDEWQSIYASYRSGSVMRNTVMGVDYHVISYKPKGETKTVKESMRCAIVIPYRVKIIIPEQEMFLLPTIEGGYVLHSMGGAKIDYVVTKIDREGGLAIASRKIALRKMQTATNRRPIEDRVVNVDVVSVGRSMCIVNYGGYDVVLNQRDVQYNMIPDLREVIHPGEIRKAKVKEFEPEKGNLVLSIKETMPHPFDGAEIRHPRGSSRVATIAGKYGGGVFCRLDDKVTDVLCSYGTMHYDGDFQIGDRVEILITKFNYDRKLIYGKMLRKLR